VEKGRSFNIKLLNKISKIKNVRLISVQKNDGIEQLNNLPNGMVVEVLSDEIDTGNNAFIDSAAIMLNVDLVITADTSIGHLAGALGVRTFLALKYLPAWRWMLNRSESPWYKNHKFFRQKRRDDWTNVFNEIHNEILNLNY